MKSFSEFKIEPLKNVFIGDKIKIVKLLNKEIIVNAFKIEKSQFPKNKSGNVMTLQITLDTGKAIIFTGSDYLMHQINLVPETDFPFKTTIIKNGEHFEFT